MSPMWREAKTKIEAWRHIRVKISGADDVCVCVVCHETKSLNQTGRKKLSVLLETARIHFYRHKLGENL